MDRNMKWRRLLACEIKHTFLTGWKPIPHCLPLE